MSTPFHDSDCAVHSEPAYPAGECGCRDCRLAELARWEASYNAVCDERDAIAKDNDKAHALLRQALSALELLKASPNIGIWVDTADEAIDAIKEFLE